MQTNKQKFPVVIIFLIGLILIGNIGFSYIIGLLVGSAEFQVINLTISLILLGASFFLSLKIIYQMDRNGSRLKRKINLFEPRGDNK